jgi:peptidyl-prolyl cis-trans isomerase SurA
MKNALRISVILFFAGLSFAVRAQSPVGVVDEVVWVIGDEAILRSDVERIRNDYGAQVKGNPYCSIPEQLAIQKLFMHQAAIDSITVSDSEVNQYVEQDITQKVMMAGSREKLEEYMRMPMAQIREELFDSFKDQLIAREMRRELTKDVKVTPAEVRRYYKDLPEDSVPYIPTQVEVQILVVRPQIPQEEIDRVKAELRGYAERITSGSTSFTTLARFYSQDEGTRRAGGELDYVGRTDLDPAFAAVAFALTDPKKVSKVVQSDFGYHIIQLIDRRGDKVKVRHILRRPEVSYEAIDAALARLDSIATDIRDNKFSFEIGAQEISDDKDTRNNHGLMSNFKDGAQTSRFEMGDLPGEVARVVDGMKEGEISKPFTMTDRRGMKVCAIVKLRARIPAHRAIITEDFQVMKTAVEAKKSEDLVNRWIREKQVSTYVRINEGWRNCDFQYPGWIK